MRVQFTVLFDDPWWVGVVERHDEAGYAVARVVFGPEPTEPEVQAFVLSRYRTLAFSAPQPAAPPEAPPPGFKRRQREARQHQAEAGLTSRAHEALRLELEQHKQERRTVSRAERQAEAERRYALRQAKQREKRRGH